MTDMRRFMFVSEAHHWADERFPAPLEPSEQPGADLAAALGVDTKGAMQEQHVHNDSGG